MKQNKSDSSKNLDQNQSKKAIKTKATPRKAELASTLAGKGKAL